MKKLFIFFYLLPFFCTAATVDTITIYSAAMKKSISCVVISPNSYKTQKSNYPVVYLLHGYSGNYSNWIQKVPSLKKQADDYQMLLICPDGGFSSWYFDSPVDSTMRYETYISKEVIKYIDTHYRTIKNKHGRAIAGLSMGGHGALFLSIRHPELFGACGSMSGGVDLLSSHNKYDIIKRIGDTTTNNPYWHDYSAVNFIENYKPSDSLAFIIDCGTSDGFYTINHQLHEKMLSLKIQHDYIERPGEHNWDYWANAVKYQLLFFRNYFNKYK
ncbi:alpha/beta hydrolase [Ferruginibacter albus]|uniref:alpha/beta hydrolase n=1 Tax=Ferruginibacter albus TaxID=2875540 RepID=UPI001CC57DC8|nr:alpha/beta hydrolase family protein [Ferruginibacter albus]UAY52396.1 esterase family protein [Ferruginibacter albus]